eukprot:6407575-Ditylum_brightwellii.AAC.1
MKSDGEDSDLDEEVNPDQTCSTRVNKVVRTNKPEDISTNLDFCHITIFDSGSEWTIIGVPAWSIHKQYSRPLNMSAVDSNMNLVAMKPCDAVTMVQNKH